MPEYNLGTAHGKVVIDYNDRGAARAGEALDRLGGKTKSYGSTADKATSQTYAFDGSVKQLGSSSAKTQSQVSALEGAIARLKSMMSGSMPAMTFAVRNLDQIKRLSSGGPGGIAAGLTLAGRATRDFTRIAGRSLPQMIGDFLGLRAVIRGVPEEMNTWPSAFRKIVHLSGLIGTATVAASSLQFAMARLGQANGPIGAAASQADRAHGSIRRMLDTVSTSFPRAYDAATDAVKGFATGTRTAITGIASLSLGVVFAQRAAREASRVYHTLGWGIERFTWAMGASGVVSLAFLNTMSGLTTVIRGAWDGVKQLSGAALLLPGAIFSVASAVTVAKIATIGMGDAFKAAVDDSQDLGEATKNLSSGAKALVYQVREVKKGWSDLQKDVQQSLFEDTADTFRSMSDQYLPAMRVGMVAVGEGLNYALDRFADFALQERTITKIRDGMKDTSETIRNSGDALRPVLEGLREIGSVGVRALADYSRAWQGYGQSFSDWARQAADSGQMRAWMDNSIQGFRDLTTLTANLGRTINNTFKPFYGGSMENALSRGAAATARWAEYMSESGPGGRAVQGFVNHLQAMAGPWVEALPEIFGDLEPVMDRLLPVMEKFSEIAAREAQIIVAILAPAMKGLLSVLEAAGPALGVWIALFSALRTLNWLRKGGMFLAAPFVNALAALGAFKRGLTDVNASVNNLKRGISGVSGTIEGPMARAATMAQRVRGTFDTVALRAMYAGDAVRNAFTRASDSLRGFDRSARVPAATLATLGPATARMSAQVAAAAPKVQALYRAVENTGSSARTFSTNLSMIPGPVRQINAVMDSAAGATRRFGSAIGSGMSRAMGGVRSAASGVLGVLGGPWGAAFMGATAVGFDFAASMASAAQTQKTLQQAMRDSVVAQRDLQTAMAFSGGKSNEETQAAAQRMVRSELEQTRAEASQSINMINDLDSAVKRNSYSYEDWAKQANNAGFALDRNAAKHEMAKLREEALNNALKQTGMSMEEAEAAFASGGPALDTLSAALRSTGDAGIAVIDQMSGVGDAVANAAARVGELGPRTAALGAALDVISDSASGAEDKLNAMVVALQALGMIDDSAFDEAQKVAQNIRDMVSSVEGAHTGVDTLGNSFFNADGSLNAFNESAGNVQDSMVDLRNSILEADPSEMMGLFEQAGPALAQMKAQLNATDEQWQTVLNTVGMTPETIQMAINIKGMDGVQQSLLMAKSAIDEADGRTVGIDIEVQDERALAVLEQMGFRIDEYDGKTGKAVISAEDSQAVEKLAGATDLVRQFNNEKATGNLDVNTAAVYAKTLQATGWINSVDGILGMGVLDANNAPAQSATNETKNMINGIDGLLGMALADVDNSPVAPKVSDSTSQVTGFNSAFGMGRIDVDNSAVASKVAWAQSVIDSIRGKTVFIDVVQRMQMVPLPAGAGTLASAAGGQTGGRFKGDYFNRLPGHAKGARHRGYQLPRTGPGTDIVDGFLALNHLGAPVARLDKEEWVINGKSSRKWNRLLAAINRDDPRLKYLPAFAEGGMMGNLRGQIGQIESATKVITQQLNIEVNAAQVEAAAAMLGQISSEEFAAKFGKGIADGLNLGSRDYFIDQGKQYSDQLGIVFGKAAQDANDRLQKEIDEIEDKNLKEQKRKLLKSTDELQAIADREMMEWVNNNQFEIMGYTMAQSFADGIKSGQNLLQAGVGALGQAATVALAAAGAPGIVAGLAVTALTGLFDAFSDPDLWADGLFEGIYKILDKMLAGLVTMVLDVLRNLFLMIGIDLAKAPIIGALYDIKDAANGTSKAVDKLMSDLEALNRLEYKNLGKMGATNIDDAIAAGLGNRVMDNRVPVGAGSPGAPGPAIGTMNVYAPGDKASDIVEAATFEMKRV